MLRGHAHVPETWFWKLHGWEFTALIAGDPGLYLGSV